MLEHDISNLPAYQQKTLRPFVGFFDLIWEGWTSDIRVNSKLHKFVSSTERTLVSAGRNYQRKTCEMLTQYLLGYYLQPGKSDLRKLGSYYGWWGGET